MKCYVRRILFIFLILKNEMKAIYNIFFIS